MLDGGGCQPVFPDQGVPVDRLHHVLLPARHHTLYSERAHHQKHAACLQTAPGYRRQRHQAEASVDHVDPRDVSLPRADRAHRRAAHRAAVRAHPTHGA